MTRAVRRSFTAPVHTLQVILPPDPVPAPARPVLIPDPETTMRLALVAMLLSVGALTADDKKDDGRKAFQGTWTIVDRKKADGKEPVTAPTVVFAGDRYQIKAGDKVVEEGTLTVDGSKSPKHVAVAATEGMDKGKKWHGVYEIAGDTMRAVVGPADKDRPTKYDNPAEGGRVFSLKREKE